METKNCFSKSYFGLPQRSIRNNSNKVILLKQTLEDVKTTTEVSMDLIRVLKNYSRIFVEKHGKMQNILILIMVDVKEKVREDILLVTRTDELRALSVYQKQIFFEIFYNFAPFRYSKRTL